MWLITLGHSLTHWYPATFYLLLPLIGKELGLSFSEIGLIMTCQYVAGRRLQRARAAWWSTPWAARAC